MPRIYNRITRPPPPGDPTDPVEDDWGSAPEHFLDEDPGEPPPAPSSTAGSMSELAGAPPEAVAALGPPPDETVAAAKWAYQLHMRLAHHAMMDSTLTPSQRRKEVRVTLAGAAKHTMDALRYDALVAIERDREELERKRRGKANAKMIAAKPVTGAAKIIPIRRDG